MNNYTGALGEVLAARYLRDRKYEILAANYRTRFGEIDIIAKEKKTLLFIEVKTRSRGMIALPMDSVTGEKQRKLSLTASQYLKHEKPGIKSRFDVIEVYLDEEQNCTQIHHIKNAFSSAV